MTEISAYDLVRESAFQKYSPLYGFNRRMKENPLELIALQNKIGENMISKRQLIQTFTNQLYSLILKKQMENN